MAGVTDQFGVSRPIESNRRSTSEPNGTEYPKLSERAELLRGTERLSANRTLWSIRSYKSEPMAIESPTYSKRTECRRVTEHDRVSRYQARVTEWSTASRNFSSNQT